MTLSVARFPGLALLVSGLLTASACAAATGRVVLPSDTTPDHYRIAIAPAADARTFAGSVDIDVTVHRATRRIVLNSADLVIEHVALDDAPGRPPRVAIDVAQQTAAFAFDRVLRPGAHTLHIRYRGAINESAAGLFALRYASPQGPRTALFTQFENSDARRFVPCWDEPGRKATFELAADVPAADFALSNMPVAASEPLAGGLRRVHFQPTPRMSTYLLYFGSGDFERAHRMVDGVDVGVVVRRGQLANADYALDAAARILPWYNAYFGTPFPLPKLDMVAGPGASQFFGAMENWGAIFYFEQAMLIDPRVATEQDRQAVFSVIAHEMAHQWFGDLVTMAWWDDLWLNEGFASWMETKVADHFHPEWHAWLRAQEEGQQAMAIDARDGTHAVITPIVDVLQAAGAFDTITYSKGKMVIRTLESYLGEEAFRAGVRRYMAAHAYGNTVTDDLWREMDRGSGRPVIDIAHDLTRQAGVPMVELVQARCTDGRTTVTLRQGRFAVDPGSSAALRWRVPIALAVPGGRAVQAVVSGGNSQDVQLADCGPVVLNAGQSGYVRVRYDAAGLEALRSAFATLAAADQLGVINDARSLAFNAQLPMAAWLDLLRAVPVDADPVVLGSLVDRLHDVDKLVDGLPIQAEWRRFARARLAPLQARVGWRAAAGESANETMLRAAVLPALATFGDAAVLAAARERFDRFLATPDSLDAETRRIVLQVVADQADAPAWDLLHRLAREARTENERDEGYTLLASTRDVALARRALDLALSGEPPVTTVPAMIAAVAVLHPRLAVDFAVAHWPAIEPLIEPDSRAQFVPHLAAGGWDEAIRPTLDRFARAHIPAGARQELVKSQATLRDQSRIRRERMPGIGPWLAHLVG